MALGSLGAAPAVLGNLVERLLLQTTKTIFDALEPTEIRIDFQL